MGQFVLCSLCTSGHGNEAENNYLVSDNEGPSGMAQPAVHASARNKPHLIFPIVHDQILLH